MSSSTHGATPYYFVPGPSRHPAMAALGLFFVIAGIRNFLRLSSRLEMKTNYGWKLPAAATVLGATSD